MNELDADLLKIFREEAEDQLSRLVDVLGAEPSSWDLALLFRLAHNMKGTARLVGADAVSAAAHDLEELFAVRRARGGGTDEEDELIRAAARRTLAAYDRLDSDPSEDANNTPSSDTLRVATEGLESLDGILEQLGAQTHDVGRHLAALGRIRTTLSSLPAQFADNPALQTQLRRVASSVRGLEERLNESQARGATLRGDLEDTSRRLRMVPFSSVASVLRRVIDDACELAGVRAALRVEGGDIEIDRHQLDALRDPLVHIVRNAVAHGIEGVDRRVSMGKAPVGSISLEVLAAGANVEIRIADDGAGIDLAALRHASGVEEGGLELVFSPGVSTAKGADELSGRGVGLDVVRRNLAAIGGTATLDTEPGRGTRFVLSAPLTRLSHGGIAVVAGRTRVVLPLASVDRVVDLRQAGLTEVAGRPMLEVDGQTLPLMRLGHALGFSDAGDGTAAVIVHSETGRRALLVDDVIGHTAFIARPLPWNLQTLRGISGVVVLGDGRASWIVDTASLAKRQVSGHAVRGPEPAAEVHRILVVDDSITSRTLEQNILRVEGFEVDVAVDGQDGWEKLSRGEYDLVITDVEMPRLDGFGLTKRMRSDKKCGAIPVILVTSLATNEHREHGVAAGADAYIVKGDFDQDELIRSVRRLL